MSSVSRLVARWYGGAAVMYEKFNAPMERAGMGAIRARLAGALHGRILEIGCGTGLNFAHYPEDAEVIAIEPLEEFRDFASERARTVRGRISVQEGNVQALPFPDHSFDAGFETLAFCSVADSLQGLLEMRRVVKPGRPVVFFEHVRSEDRWVAFVQDTLNPVWRWLADGCNINRDTVETIRSAGFRVDLVETHEIRVPRMPRFPLREIQARA